MNMIWADIWHMDTVSVSTRPHFLVDKAPEPHDVRVVKIVVLVYWFAVKQLYH